jgi:peptide/nickel transport system substrate-binding protein
MILNQVSRLFLFTLLFVVFVAPPASAGGVIEKPALGAQLIGKLEGYEIIRDPARIPKKFNEAPMLAQLVKAGKLPPVEKRLPEEPLVVKPVREIGKYGGTWRRGFTGPADGENGNRLSAVDKFIFWDYTGTKIQPSVAKDWKVSEDGKTITLTFRKGMKWSDGQPFSADDVMFWYQDIYLNKDLVPTPLAEMSIAGKPGRIVKVDDLTVAFQFDAPYFLFESVLAGDMNIGRGQSAGQFGGRFFGGYAPKHYLKNYLPKYVPEADLNAQAKAAGFDSWKSLIRFKIDWQKNTELPVLAPWRTTSPITAKTWVLERNPYYWEVDTAGNQLPYIDTVVMTLAENLEVLNLRAVAGEIDFQARHIDIQKLPVFLENQAKGDYKVYLDPGVYGSDTVLQINHAYSADPQVAKWLHNRDFRRALSLGIDRDQINEAFFLGLGTPGSAVPSEGMNENPGPEWRKKWSVYDLKQANEILDRIGLAKKDAEGFRLRTDGKGRLRIEMQAAAAAFLPWAKHAEMIADQWKKIGIWADVKEFERNLFFTRCDNNEQQISLWTNGGTEMIYLYPHHALPVAVQSMYGVPIYKWVSTDGKDGMKPEDPMLLKALELYKSAGGLKQAERDKVAQEIWKLYVDEQFGIGAVGLSPAFLGVRIVSNKMGNVPDRQVNAQHMRTPTSARPTTLFFKR